MTPAGVAGRPGEQVFTAWPGLVWSVPSITSHLPSRLPDPVPRTDHHHHAPPPPPLDLGGDPAFWITRGRVWCLLRFEVVQNSESLVQGPPKGGRGGPHGAGFSCLPATRVRPGRRQKGIPPKKHRLSRPGGAGLAVPRCPRVAGVSLSLTKGVPGGKGRGPGRFWLTNPRVSRLIVAAAGDHRSLIRGFPMGSQPRALTACLLACLPCLRFSPCAARRCGRGTISIAQPPDRWVGVCVPYIPLWDSILVFDSGDGHLGGTERGGRWHCHTPSPSRSQWFGRPPVHPPRS
jgi:hypothetical protein